MTHIYHKIISTYQKDYEQLRMYEHNLKVFTKAGGPQNYHSMLVKMCLSEFILKPWESSHKNNLFGSTFCTHCMPVKQARVTALIHPFHSLCLVFVISKGCFPPFCFTHTHCLPLLLTADVSRVQRLPPVFSLIVPAISLYSVCVFQNLLTNPNQPLNLTKITY